MIDNISISHHETFLKHLIAGDRDVCLNMAKDYKQNNTPIYNLYETVFKNALYKIGELWEYNKITVATEHLSSAIIESILNEFYTELISNNRTNKKAIVACVENEHHQIGIKMISDVFEINGWSSYFLGANTPTNELISFSKSINPDILAVSVSLYFHIPLLEKMIQQIREEFPSLVILVGGQAFLHGGHEILSKHKNVVYKPDLTSAELFIQNFQS